MFKNGTRKTEALRDAREERSEIREKMSALNELALKEDRGFTDKEQRSWDECDARTTMLGDRCQRIEREMGVNEFSPQNGHVTRGNDGTYEQLIERYDEARTLRYLIDPDSEDGGEAREVSEELCKRSGREARGLRVPLFEKRATMTTTGSAAGAYPEKLRGDLYIDPIRAALVTGRLGARVLTGLQGDTHLPRFTAGSVGWIGEDAIAPESNGSVDQVSLTPHTVSAWTEVSRRAAMNGSPDVIDLIMSDFRANVAGAIDAAALNGSGTGDVPLGVLNTTGVGVTNFAAATPTWDETLAVVTEVADVSALGESPGFAVHPSLHMALRATTKDAGSGQFVATADRIADYNTGNTALMPNGQLLFGDFSQLIIGLWSGVDLLVNPYSDAVFKKGGVAISVFQDCDIAVRHPQAFAVGSA